MTASTETFRTALHGFNRTDVVQFIQKNTMEHEKELRLLREENAQIQQELDTLRSDAARLRLINADLTNELEALRQAQAAVPAQPELDAPLPPVTTVAAAAPSDFNEQELAAYRRAELVERMARERAAASVARMNTAFSQANAKLTLTNQDLSTLLDTFRADYEQLQQIIGTVQGIFQESSESLKAAAEVCDEI